MRKLALWFRGTSTGLPPGLMTRDLLVTVTTGWKALSFSKDRSAPMKSTWVGRGLAVAGSAARARATGSPIKNRARPRGAATGGKRRNRFMGRSFEDILFQPRAAKKAPDRV